MSLFQGKKITVIGLGRSGLSAAKLLREKGACVSVSDGGNTCRYKSASEELKSLGIDVELGCHNRCFIEGRDMIVVSPGVGPNALPCLWAQELGVEILSEIELGFLCCPATIIAITGTNGKTTTTTLGKAGTGMFMSSIRILTTPFSNLWRKVIKKQSRTLSMKALPMFSAILTTSALRLTISCNLNLPKAEWMPAVS